MNIEILGRKAIEIIKSEWGLPRRGFIAGGSISNIIWEFVSGNKAVVNDIDVFIFDSFVENIDETDKNILFKYQEKDIKYYEDYGGICFSTHTKDFYSIIESERDGVFNNIRYSSNTYDPSSIIKSFDINCTRIGYSIEKDQLYWTVEFEEFLKSGKLEICNLMTPSHTAVRIAKKGKDLNIVVDEFEFKLLQHTLTGVGLSSNKFVDIIKLRFKDRYLDLFRKNADVLEKYFMIGRDFDSENYVRNNFKEDVKLFYLHPCKIISKNTNEIFGVIQHNIFDDENITKIQRSIDFLFYMRNIYGNSEMMYIWSNLYFFFGDINYVDREVSKDDLELLSRFSKYAPNSIENLKGYKLSEQIDIVKKFLDKFKEDPIIAISILEKVRVDKDIELDEQTSLILELSVRKDIVNDTKGKVNKILNIEELHSNDDAAFE